MTGTVDFQRLPKTVVPRHYALYLHPDLVGLTFTGHVVCDIEVSSGHQACRRDQVSCRLKVKWQVT